MCSLSPPCLLRPRSFFVRLLSDIIFVALANRIDTRRRDVTTFLWRLRFLLEKNIQLLEKATTAAGAVRASAAAFSQITLSFAHEPSHEEEARPQQGQTDAGGHSEVEQKGVALASVLL